MEQRDLEVLAHFEEVWERVQRSRTGETESENDDLKVLMDKLHYGCCGLRQLARCTQGTEKSCLLALSKEIKKQLHVLQLHYFLQEGDVYFPTATPNFASYTPYNLRKLWQSTVENAEWVKNCNLKGDSVFVAEVEKIEESLKQQKNMIERLIGKLLQ